MCQLVGSNNMMIANAENEMDAETKTYIVMADSSKEFNDVTNIAAFSISEEDPELADNNIAVMELSPEEAEEMQQNDGFDCGRGYHNFCKFTGRRDYHGRYRSRNCSY